MSARGYVATIQSWSFQGKSGASSATFSPCGTWRYELRRAWDGKLPTLLAILCNPSKADAMSDDPSVRRVISFAAKWGCGGLVLANAFGLRSTDPEALYQSGRDPVGPENDATIERILRAHPDSKLLVAWGAHGAFKGRSQRVGEMVMDIHGAPECLGVTQGGEPKHPLYIAYRCELQPWKPKKESR